MGRGKVLKYLVGLFFLSWAVIPCHTEVSAQPSGQAVPEGAGFIDGRNPNRKPRREGDPLLEAYFITDSVGIGDTVTLRVEITKDILQIVALGEINREMLEGQPIELVSQTELDTVRQDGRQVKLRKDITFQVFDEGYLDLGWMPAFYLDKNIADTIWSVDSLVLMVGTYQIDTLTQTIHDIRGVMDTPMVFGEYGGYLLWCLLGLAVIAAGLWYWFTRRRNLTMFGKPKVVDPPHVVAIKALESLHNQKLWQNNRHKQYYTGITDILRQYMEDRWHIGAMEMTSDEILVALSDRELPEKGYRDLGEILRTADLVKFAKFVPEAEQNENMFTYAYYFVEETKPTEIENPETEEGIVL
ncbi:MAG: hypothetical protein LIO85_04860 [Rikenellaceae bacterium]|nr:hypothetical protein [Rikenellaceae bacterium]